jgi:hypothetical protein
MISLRSLTHFASVAVVAVALAACNDGPANPLSRGLSASGANFDGKAGNTGNAAKNGDIDVRVLLDKSGNAVLQIRTGAYDPTTNIGTPDGYFQQIQYKLYDARGKQVLTRNVHFKTTGIQSYATWIDLCAGNGDDDNDDDDANAASECSSKIALNWRVSVQANLKGVGGDDKKTDVVREDGVNGYLPDIDLSHSLVALAGVPNAPASAVPANVATTFNVDVANLIVPGGSNTGATAQVSCLVIVDGFPQLPLPNGARSVLNPNAYGFVGNPVLTVVPNGHTPCQFTLTLPAGTHKIVVTGVVLSPGDYDLSNNSTVTFTVTASSRPTEISAGMLQVDLGAGPVNLDPPPSTGAPAINPNKQINLDQVVALNDGAPPGQVTCTATITPPAGAAVTLVATANLTTAPGVSCIMPYTFPAPGDYTYSVDITPTDGVPANNHKGPITIHVSNPPKFAVATVGPITVLSGASHTALTDTVVHSGESMQYTADITAALTGTTSTSVTCNAIVDGAQVPASAWVGGQTGTVTTTSPTKTCTFNLTLNDASVAASGAPHDISIGVTTPSDVPNLAPIGPGLNTATNKGQVFVATRLDLRAGPFVLVGTPNQLLSSTTIPQVTSTTQTKTITVQDTVYGPALASVNCGPINLASGTVNAASVLAILNPQLTTTNPVSIPSSSKSVCQYTISTPAQLGLGAFPLVANVSNNGNALDPTPANNTATGTLDVEGNGTFTTVPTAREITASQGWLNSGSWPNDDLIETLNTQLLSIKHLALVVVPTQDVLGHFKLAVTVTSGPNDATVFGTQTVEGDLFKSTGAENCNAAQVGPNALINNPNEPLNSAGNTALGYAASVCANTSDASFQEVSVNYSQNLIGTVAGNGTPAPLLFTDHVTLTLTLRFTLSNSTHEQAVTAKAVIPVTQFRGGDCLPLTGDENAPRACSTAFGDGVVTTP